VRDLGRRLVTVGDFDLSASPYFRKVRESGFVSGRSKHGDRIATIRELWKKYGVMIDPHTADGVKIGLDHREPGVPLVCLETALPVKFSETIKAALGRDAERPAELKDLESLPQRFQVIDADPEAVKRAVAANS
jgi:threonine synthase